MPPPCLLEEGLALWGDSMVVGGERPGLGTGCVTLVAFSDALNPLPGPGPQAAVRSNREAALLPWLIGASGPNCRPVSPRP